MKVPSDKPYRNPIKEKQAVSVPKNLAGEQAEKDWTVLYYMDGCNDLEPYIMQNMRDIEQVGSGRSVNIVAQMSRGDKKSIYGKKREKTNMDGDWVGMRRYYITKAPAGARKLHSAVLSSDVDPPNHGKATSIADFVSWGMKKFPSKHTIVVVSDHGKGFVGTGFDRFSKDHLKLGELKEGLANAVSAVGRKPDVVIFDACEMANLEVAHQLKDVANVLVGSEEVLGAEGLPHIAFLKNLAKMPKQTPQQHAATLVEMSGQDEALRRKQGRYDTAVQFSAIDLTKVAALSKRVLELGEHLQSSSESNPDLKKIVESTKHFCEKKRVTPDSDYRDLGHFCQNLVESDKVEASTKKIARKVLKEIDKVIIAHQKEGPDMENANGISVYLPNSPVPEQFNRRKSWGKFDDSYHDTDFDRDTNWSTWINDRFKK